LFIMLAQYCNKQYTRSKYESRDIKGASKRGHDKGGRLWN
jgi:hypothetical protein